MFFYKFSAVDALIFVWMKMEHHPKTTSQLVFFWWAAWQLELIHM